ncbi:putative metal ion transporter YfjQ [Halobacillus andaensis]|uniref:Magnesium transport protein CorA n=1 Tax=Halobacillus andaensis TaxID=1176239 RepID=A0A917B0V8_HALAA|nr:magnesium/cobalt transporter CorA [Halobacillus andaensis]MBP2003705.1 magnesium transporter [Halobacillus andaensis]GGF12591.1 putative metal ion transporter YfjQ [Halobacillus andaensis]
MLRIYGYSKTDGLQQFSDLAELTTAAYDWYWVDYEKPTQEEIGTLRTYFQFHPLAIEDCLHDLQRPKLDYYEDHTFFVFHALHKKSLDRSEINLFLGEDFVVTFHKQPCEEIDSIERLLKRNGQNNELDEYFILYQLLDKVVDHYFPIVYDIEDHINEIEDNTRNLSMEQLLEELFDRRSELLKIRQTVHPMRDLLYRMLNTHHLEGVRDRKEYFADVYDHLIKVAEIVASNREMTQDIRDSYLSLNSHQTNRTMQILTVISVIFMPLTFVVGVYGMNFVNMPELNTESGYFVVWFIMIAMAVTMVFWFKKKGWFD